MNILTYFPYIRSPLTNILRAYCDIRSVFFIISRAFVDMYSARFTMCCQNFVICGSFSYRLALRSLRLTANTCLEPPNKHPSTVFRFSGLCAFASDHAAPIYTPSR